MTMWVRSASVDIGEQPTSDLLLARLAVGDDALVRGEHEESEVPSGEEPGLVPLAPVAGHGDPGFDDAAGVDAPRQLHVVLAPAAVGDEGELLDELVLAEDP